MNSCKVGFRDRVSQAISVFEIPESLAGMGRGGALGCHEVIR